MKQVVRKSAITRERVLAESLRMIDETGLQGLSMRKLGVALGTDPMLIYRVFPSKAALLDGVMEMLWSEVRVDPDAEDHGDWRVLLIDVMHRLRQTLIAHPNAVAIIGTRPANGPELFLLLERLLASLVAAGMEIDNRTADLLNALVNYTVGHVLAEVVQPVGGESAENSVQEMNPARFPYLAAVFNSGWEYNPLRQFDRALHTLVMNSGVETLANKEETV